MTEQELRQKVVDIAVSYLGCKESDGSHKKIIDLYNSHKPLAVGYKMSYTDAWCSCFASAVAIKAGLTDIIPTEVGCERHIQLFKNKGSWVENDAYVPKPGDYIFYNWDDTGAGDCTAPADHVGIVEKVSGSTITVIEGNNSNAVRRRTIAVNGRYIRGYGVPNYASKATGGASSGGTSNNSSAAKKSVDDIAKEIIQGKWGVGEDRKKKLTAAGYDYTAVQKKVNEMLSGKTGSSSTPSTNKKSVDDIAREVISGKWGVGTDRKQKLTAAGYDYSTVQKRVNELLR